MKKYKVEERAVAGGSVIFVWVPGEDKAKAFRPGQKHKNVPYKETARERANKYIAQLESEGYTLEKDLVGIVFDEIKELGGDTSTLLKTFPR